MATYNGHYEDSSGNILLPIPVGGGIKVETGTTATQAYAKGAYFYANNRFCKAKTAIASGDTFTSGTNVTYTSIGAELKAHITTPDGVEFSFTKLVNGDYN